MRVEPFMPDVPPSPAADADPSAFAKALDALGTALDGAQRSEDGFARGRTSLQTAMYERARAGVALDVAAAVAQHAAAALTAVTNMQV